MWLYVLECKGGVLYTGIAKDVDKRFEVHLKGAGAMFTRLNRPVRILGRALLPSKGDALRAEAALKKLSRADKLRWCAMPGTFFAGERSCGTGISTRSPKK